MSHSGSAVVTNSRCSHLCLPVFTSVIPFLSELGERVFILSILSHGDRAAFLVGVSAHTFCCSFLDLTRGQESKGSGGWQLEEQAPGVTVLLKPQLR